MNKLIKSIVSIVTMFNVSQACAQVELVKDINQTAYGISSGINNQIVVNGELFFTADFENGIELYKSDGTVEGTVLVKDINPGSGSSDPRSMINVNGILFFVATTIESGYELWKSDGTENGTTLVKETFPGPGSLGITDLMGVDHNLFFFVPNTDNTYSLWITDGSENGTSMIRQFSNRPTNLEEFNGLLSFYVDGSYWTTDGSSIGTQPFYQLENSQWIGISKAVNGLLYYTTGGLQANRQQLWVYNGIDTKYIDDIATRFVIEEYSSLNNEFYFIITNLGNPASRKEIWKTVNRDEGIEKVIGEIQTQTLLELTRAGDNLYFSAHVRGHSTIGPDLWKTDGTPEGTGLVAGLGEEPRPVHLTDHNGLLYFVIEADDGNREIYRSDGIEQGTFSVMDNNGDYSVPKDLYSSGSHLFFLKHENLSNGTELHVLNDSPGGLKLTSIVGNYGSRPNDFRLINDEVYFRAKSSGAELGSSQSGFDVWKTDGTSAGTVSLSELVPNNNVGFARTITSHNSELYIENTQGELWKTDGTLNGTLKLAAFEFGFSLYNLTSAGDFLFFPDASDRNNIGLWKTNGTIEGTNKVLDLPNSVLYSDFIKVEDRVFFTLFNAEYGLELWVSNGLPGGTTIVKDIVAGDGSSSPEQLVSLNGILYFVADDQVHGEELWRSDGTEAGTYMVVDLEDGSNSPRIRNLTVANDKLYFEASPFLKNGGLWISDGTEEGTNFLHDLDRLYIGASPTHFTVIGNDVYFASYVTSSFTRGVWKTDGTPEGTMRLGEVEGLIYAMRENNGQLFFTLTRSQLDASLWRVGPNMTEPEFITYFGPYFRRDGYPGSSPLEDLFSYNDGFLIPGSTNTLGSELWRFTYVNEFNAIVNHELDINENSELGTLVGTLEVVESVNPIGFAIKEDNPFYSAFMINDDGDIFVNDSVLLDFEETSEITLTILISTNGDVIQNDIVIRINDLNESPSINEDQEFSLPVTSQDGFQLGTVKANDPEQDDLSFEIVSTDLDGAFSVTNDGILILANSTSIVESSKSEFQLIVSVSDGALQSEGTITIKLIESVVEDDEFEIVENSPNGSVVGSLMNLNENAEWTLSIKSGNDDSAFEIGENGELIVEDSSKIDFELNQKFELVVQASYESEIDEATYIITVTDVNEAPVMTKTTLSFNENPAAQGKIGAIPATDPEDDNLTYTITSGNGGGNYVIVDDTLRANTPAYFDFETFSTDTLIVSAADAAFSDSDTIFVKLLNVNEPLVFADTILSIDENSTTNKLVGQLVADDPEGINATFKILTFTPDSAFSINGASNLIVSDSALLDFEINPVFTLTVEATDGTFKDTATVTININDVFEIVNDKPDFPDQSFNVAENSAIGSIIGTLIASDTIEGPLTYRVLTGNELSIVTLADTSGVLSVNDSSAFDFETNSSFEFEIEASDGLLTDTATVTVFLLDVSEPPSVDEGVFSINENSPAATLVGKLNGTDGDGDVLSFALGEGNDGAFAINNAGTITVVNSTKLNFEVQEVFEITVLVSDGVDTINTTATINILDVNDPPRFTNKLFEIAENPVVGDSVGNLNAFDEDGDEITFVIRDGNVSNAFAITTDGEIVVANEEAIDFEQRTTITLVVSALDGNVDFEDIVEIKITDLIDNIQITGIDEVPIAKFYPNPTINRLTVEALEPIEQLRIVDLAGRMMTRLTEPVRDRVVIDVSSFQSGIYILIVDHQAFKFMKR